MARDENQSSAAWPYAETALLLADAEWSQWSNREIARRCRVAPSVVDWLRPSLSASERQMHKRKVQRGGTVYEMNVNVSSAAAPDTAPVDSNHAISNPRGAWERG